MGRVASERLELVILFPTKCVKLRCLPTSFAYNGLQLWRETPNRNVISWITLRRFQEISMERKAGKITISQRNLIQLFPYCPEFFNEITNFLWHREKASMLSHFILVIHR